jgi:phage FluMu gp28-like protein
LSNFKARLRRLEDRIDRLKAARLDLEIEPDPVGFCIKRLGFKPTVYQEKLLRDPAQFIVARWARQSGKTHCVSVLLLWLCLRNHGFNVLVVAPSIRQSKIIIRKIAGLLHKLPRLAVLKPQKTKIEFYNGSRIQACPNSPETIRGESAVGLVYADEFGYVRDDRDLYDAVSFTVATTNGRFLATSTPGSRDSLFYAMCTDDENYGDFSRHHVTYKDALEPNGPLKQEVLEKLKRQMAMEPWRWQREMMAEFADDVEAWLPMALISKCVDQDLEYIPEDRILTA